MIGIYDYTVILTYLSLLSAVTGIMVCTFGSGHPYIGSFFLLFCGLCDTFDGIVARSKPGRTEKEKCFGMQIDSLSDLVAFGVLPAAIAISLLTSGVRRVSVFNDAGVFKLYSVLYFAAALFFVLAAMVRLAWFNVLELHHEGTDEEGHKRYVGLPVTASALIFPLILLLNYLTVRDFSLAYFVALPVVGCLFLGRFTIRKPSRRTLILLIAIGAAEFFLMALYLHIRRR
ncbi:MAG: CDP-alcohol phosphatidyltransferase family protein [Oscillospiraceae bacterium]|nr:CDP-alcohol phosphatidyltransferase family protein [Oscillospiraceae bacterium]